MKARHEFLTEEEWLSYLKTYFAAKAMQGLLVNFTQHGHYGNSNHHPMVAQLAVEQAYALINALNQKP